jgi:hypothetical protein
MATTLITRALRATAALAVLPKPEKRSTTGKESSSLKSPNVVTVEAEVGIEGAVGVTTGKLKRNRRRHMTEQRGTRQWYIGGEGNSAEQSTRAQTLAGRLTPGTETGVGVGDAREELQAASGPGKIESKMD